MEALGQASLCFDQIVQIESRRRYDKLVEIRFRIEMKMNTLVSDEDSTCLP